MLAWIESCFHTDTNRTATSINWFIRKRKVAPVDSISATCVQITDQIMDLLSSADVPDLLSNILLSSPDNAVCIDCGVRDNEWASLGFGTLICLNCAGFHRSLGAHITSVRSIKLDSWSDAQAQLLRIGGNRAFKVYYNEVSFGSSPTHQATASQKAVSMAALNGSRQQSTDGDIMTLEKRISDSHNQNNTTETDNAFGKKGGASSTIPLTQPTYFGTDEEATTDAQPKQSKDATSSIQPSPTYVGTDQEATTDALLHAKDATSSVQPSETEKPLQDCLGLEKYSIPRVLYYRYANYCSS